MAEGCYCGGGGEGQGDCWSGGVLVFCLEGYGDGREGERHTFS